MATIESRRYPPIHMYLAQLRTQGDKLLTQHAATTRCTDQRDATITRIPQRGMPEQPLAVLSLRCQRGVDAMATQGPRRTLTHRQHNCFRLQWRERGGVTHRGRTGKDQQLIRQRRAQLGTGISVISHATQGQAGQQQRCAAERAHPPGKRRRGTRGTRDHHAPTAEIFALH